MDPFKATMEPIAGTQPKDMMGATPTNMDGQVGAAANQQAGEGVDETGNDAEGVWSPDIEQAFQEALAIYPPCGRRKIILSDEGKMYGRNELIARYIKLRTGKQRTRKQVSSHIQVLARKKSREIQGKIKVYNDQAARDKALAGLSAMSSAQIVSASILQNTASSRMFGTPGIAGNAVPMHTMLSPPVGAPNSNPVVVKHELLNPAAMIWNPQAGGGHFGIPNSMASHPEQQFAPPHLVEQPTPPNIPPPNLPLKMVEFVAFVDKTKSETDPDKKHEFVNIDASTSFMDPGMEAVDIRHIQDKFPEKNGGLKDLYDKGPQDRFFLVKFWADLNTVLLDETSAFYGVTSQYECSENMTISCSTKVCSFGKQVVEKVETEYSRFDNGRFVFRINRSPMCDYMVSFIHRLKHLPEKYMMNSVLENFTILQVVTNRDTQDTLLCLAYVFEVVTNDDGPKHRVYRLIKEN
ncbi:transcriptional enhancer factor TEF-1-like isoform X2 [Halichondria panicea]|uniref:transcriptional enhancer factor TEF-1-like isoform X2 n=1 Tax=Halichondria panicea TaxID=6063 RepID=UPI00312B91B0